MKSNRSVTALALASTIVLSSFSPAMAQGKGQTTLRIYNGSNNTVTAYMQIVSPDQQSPNPGYLTSVQQVPFKPPVNLCYDGPVKPVGTIPTNQVDQGHFDLAPGKLTTITLPVGNAMSGNISFGAAPVECPGGSSETFAVVVPPPPSTPNGVNFARFTLDNNTPSFGPGSQETLDINCAYGVNSSIQIDMYSAAGTSPWSTDKGGPTNVTQILNQPLGTQNNSKNVNKVGVFPPGCEACTSNNDDSGCWGYWPPSSKSICLVHRPASGSGGNVMVTFKGIYPTNSKAP